MTTKESQVTYQTTNTYTKLNTKTPQTLHTWFCCHGIGFLSRYFIRYFNTLDSEKNQVIAPQAPSKYYQKSDFKYVGASWLTRENTKAETQNVLNYFDAISKIEDFEAAKKLIVFGFSQGVSVSLRWMASRKVDCDLLVIYAGAIPTELTPADFTFLKKAKVMVVYGTRDEYFDQARADQEVELAKSLFGAHRVEVLTFEGTHEMKAEVVEQLAAKL